MYPASPAPGVEDKLQEEEEEEGVEEDEELVVTPAARVMASLVG